MQGTELTSVNILIKDLKGATKKCTNTLNT